MSDFEIRGMGSDWSNFFYAASVQGLVQQLCVDVHDVLSTSAELEKGRHIWALAQSWLFDCKGKGQFVIQTDQAFKALKLISPKKEWIVTEQDGELIFASDDNDEIRMKLLDLEDHIDPNNSKSSYITPKAEAGNQRIVMRLINESGLPIPVPAWKDRTDPYLPWPQTLRIQKSSWTAQIKSAKEIDCDLIVLKTIETSPNITFYLESGRQIGKEKRGEAKIRGMRHVPAFAENGTIDWQHSFDRDHLEAVVASNNSEELYLAMCPHEDQPYLWVGFNITGSRKRTTNDPAITMACYIIGDVDSRQDI